MASGEQLLQDLLLASTGPALRKLQVVAEDVPCGMALQIAGVDEMSSANLEACFALVRDNMKAMYSVSSFGWSAASKRREMREPDTKYVLLQNDTELAGFASFQPTLEEGRLCFYMCERCLWQC